MATVAGESDVQAKARWSEDPELRQFRELMSPPDRWEEGFGLKAMIGGLFVGLIMTPASMYMSLVVGQDIGGAAQWVTIILFIEVARRAFTQLKRPEIYVLYYMAGALLISGSGLLWSQFLAQSNSFKQFGISVPSWVAPSDPNILGSRNFFQAAWIAPIGLMALGQILQRVDHFGLGYVMYRLTSDVEKLPFPMAPVAAQGVTALADASGGHETWRWRVFSFGAMLGMVFGAVYLALPAITGAFLPEPISIFPLPFKDLTPNTESFLPAVPVMLAFDLGLVISGMVLPFNAMVGSFIGLVLCTIANPILYHYGVLHSWSRGIGWNLTIQANTLDFYFSFGLGLTAAVAAIGFWQVFGDLFRRKKELDRVASADELEPTVRATGGAGRYFDLDRAADLCLLDHSHYSHRLFAASACAHHESDRQRGGDENADGRTGVLWVRLYADHQLCIGKDGGDHRDERECPVCARGDIHPHGLQGGRNLVRAVPGVQLRRRHPTFVRRN